MSAKHFFFSSNYQNKIKNFLFWITCFLLASCSSSGGSGGGGGGGEINEDNSEINIDTEGRTTVISVEDFTITFTAPSAIEGETLEFEFFTNKKIDATTTISYSIKIANNDTASLDDLSFTTLSKTATINTGETSATIFVNTRENRVVELDKTFSIQLDKITSYKLDSSGDLIIDASTSVPRILKTTVKGTILNDDTADIGFVTKKITTNEGQTASFEVAISHLAAFDITADFIISAIGYTSNTAITDYAKARLWIAAGENTGNFKITALNDGIPEPTEHFLIQLKNFNPPISASTDRSLLALRIADSSTTSWTINDNDSITLTLSGPETIGEGASGIFTVRSNRPAQVDLSLQYRIEGVGSNAATVRDFEGGSYPTGEIRIPAEHQEATFEIRTTKNSVTGDNKNFAIHLFNSNSLIGDIISNDKTIRIKNDDFYGVSIVAANAGYIDEEASSISVKISITKEIAALFESGIEIGYKSIHGTAGDNDYDSVTGTVRLTAANPMQDIEIRIKDDNIVELDESFNIILTNISEDLLTNDTQTSDTIIIRNNDTASIFFANPINRFLESETSTDIFTLIQSSNPIAVPITLAFNISASNLRILDYQDAITSAILPADTTSINPSIITILPDDSVELEEHIIFILETINIPVGFEEVISIGSRNRHALIVHDQDIVTISFLADEVFLKEGDSYQIFFTFNKSIEYTIAFKLNVFNMQNELIDDAESGRSRFLPETINIFTVTSYEDGILEKDIQLELRLTTTDNNFREQIIFENTQTLTIQDDDTADIKISTSQNVAVEGGENAVFQVSTSKLSRFDITIDYSIQSTKPATTGDYAVATNTIRIPKGQLSVDFEIAASNDDITEGLEKFTIRLDRGNSENLFFPNTNRSASWNIATSDAATLTISGSTSILEARTGNYKIKTNKPTEVDLILNYEVIPTGDGDNRASRADFKGSNFPSGELIIPAGQTQANFEISTAYNDIKADKNFSIHLTKTSNLIANFSSINYSVTIENELLPNGISISGVDEINEGTKDFVTISASFNSFTDTRASIEVGYRFINGTASSADYNNAIHRVELTTQDTIKTITISITDDNIVELDETFDIELINIPADLISRENSKTITITDTDKAVIYFEVITGIVDEADIDATATILSSNPIAEKIILNLSTSDIGNSLSMSDYQDAMTSVILPQGKTSISPSIITIRADEIVELTESIQFILAPIVSNFGERVTISSDSSIYTLKVQDQDKAVISFVDATGEIIEGNIGTQLYSTRIRSSNPIALDVTFDISLSSSNSSRDSLKTGEYHSLSFMLPAYTTAYNADIVAIVGDKILETDEVGEFILTARNLASLSDSINVVENTHKLTIKNDDSVEIVLLTNSLIVNEGTSGKVAFDITGTSEINIPVTFEATGEHNSATIGEDYSFLVGSFPPILHSQQIQITLFESTNDRLIETEEQVSAQLIVSNPHVQITGNNSILFRIKNKNTINLHNLTLNIPTTIELSATSFHATVNLQATGDADVTATIAYYRSVDKDLSTTNDNYLINLVPPPDPFTIISPANISQIVDLSTPVSSGDYYYFACAQTPLETVTNDNCSSIQSLQVINTGSLHISFELPAAAVQKNIPMGLSVQNLTGINLQSVIASIYQTSSAISSINPADATQVLEVQFGDITNDESININTNFESTTLGQAYYGVCVENICSTIKTILLVAVDKDGDKLIDIATRERLEHIEYNLTGSSYKYSANAIELKCGIFGELDCEGYELIANIDLGTRNWNSLGKITGFLIPFGAVFYGNNHTISNLNINTNSTYSGLFASIEAATIKDLTIDNPIILSTENIVGALAGSSQCSFIQNVQVINTNNGSIEGRNSVGGLIGNFTPPVYGNTNCNDVFNIITYASSSVSVNGNDDIGGLVGKNSGIIKNSWASGAVTGSNSLGGLVGNGDIDDIKNSWASGAVTGSTRLGGLIGSNFGGTFKNIWSIGAVTGSSNLGGLIGSNFAGTFSSNVYWNTETNGQFNGDGENSAEVIGATTNAMISSTGIEGDPSFAGWKTTDTSWDFRDTNSYPILLNNVANADLQAVHQVAGLLRLADATGTQFLGAASSQNQINNLNAVDFRENSVLAVVDSNGYAPNNPARADFFECIAPTNEPDNTGDVLLTTNGVNGTTITVKISEGTTNISNWRKSTEDEVTNTNRASCAIVAENNISSKVVVAGKKLNLLVKITKGTQKAVRHFAITFQ